MDIEVNHAPPFVGRQPELRSVLRFLEEAKGGVPRLVLVGGEAGVGKTRLLGEVVREAERRGMRACEGRFVESGALPYYALVSTLVPQLSAAGLLTAGALGPGAETLSRLAGLGGKANDEPAAEGGHAGLYTALTRAVLALARARPLLYVVDDFQWADAEARGALAQVVIGIAEAMHHGPVPVCLLIGHRTAGEGAAFVDDLLRLRREPWSRDLPLEGMTEPELAQLVHGAVGATCAPGLLHLLREATGGVGSSRVDLQACKLEYSIVSPK